MSGTKVFVGLGGNIGDTISIFHDALERISGIEGVSEVKNSRFYQTTPVSSIEQEDFINAVCSFETSRALKSIHKELKKIEQELGKKDKERDEPRVIDLDLLFFGDTVHSDKDIQIPHPRWSERMFVLVPLFDLVKEVCLADPKKGSKKLDIKKLLKEFNNVHNEKVTPITE